MNWYRDLRLRWKLFGAFGLILSLTTLLSVLAYRGVVDNDESAALVNDTRGVLDLADQALISLIDMETGLRGFLLTGRDDYLEPYTSAQAVYRQRFNSLQAATAPSTVSCVSAGTSLTCRPWIPPDRLTSSAHVSSPS